MACRSIMHRLVPVIALSLFVVGCAKQPKVDVHKDGYPVWMDNPYFEQDVNTSICTSGESDFAAADVEAAKTDAETAAKNRVADQINAKVGRLVERSNTAMKDLANGDVYGERTLKDINQNYIEMTLPGLRYLQYHYLPNRVSPEKVFVHACVNFDTVEMSKQITQAMLGAAAAREDLEIKHEEAQLRFEQVRKSYLAEEAAKNGE